MAANANTDFIELLEEELARYRRVKGGSCPKNLREVAELLGIDVTVLSKYRSGDRFLTQKVAEQFAEALRNDELGGSEADRAELATRLVTAVPEPPDGDSHARKWLNERGAPGNLLIAEFRELPAGRPRGPHEGLARDVGRAIANGLSYGLVWPFSVKSLGNTKIPFHFRTYLSEIWNGVQQTYLRVLNEAFAEVVHQRSTVGAKKEEGHDSTLRSELEAASSRMRVYVLRDGGDVDFERCPGIGYKLFFIRDKGRKAELYQWVSVENVDRIAEKTTTENELAAVESRFYPISQFFQDSAEPWHMPDNSELTAYADDNVAQAAINAVPANSPWVQYEIIAEHLLKGMIDKAIPG